MISYGFFIVTKVYSVNYTRQYEAMLHLKWVVFLSYYYSSATYDLVEDSIVCILINCSLNCSINEPNIFLVDNMNPL